MPQARLALTIPESTWIHDVSVAHPDLTFQVNATLAGETSGIALLELHVDDPLPVIAAIRDRDDVVDLELLWKRDDRALLQVETTHPFLLVPAWRAGVPLTTPFEIRDGTATWEVTTSNARLSSLGEHLDDVGIAFDIEYVRDVGEGAADRLLTDRQQELLLAALAQGYYDNPREATLSAVADSLDVSKSTCSDVLHRAEGAVLRWFADEHVAGTPS
ncbi:MAG: helix-turn-helix domain-containing protein [Haloarculaceae archaeon]